MSYKPYISASLDHLHMRPVLPLGIPLSIGDVVTIDRGTLHPVGTIQDLLGVQLGETLPPERKISTTLRSGRGVSARLLAKGEASELFPAAPSAKVRLEVSMEGRESCLALVTEPSITRLKNPHALFPAMVESFKTNNHWNRPYVLVYQVAEPRHLHVLISKHSDTRILLEAQADVEIPAANIAELGGSFGIQQQNNEVVEYRASGAIAFFNGYRVKEDIFGGEGISPFGEFADPFEEADEIGELSDDPGDDHEPVR